jgi:hypothetical protein
MNAKKIRDILNDGKIDFNNEALVEAREKYKSVEAPSRETRREWLDYSEKLIDCMLANNATNDEFDRAVLFIYVCIDSIKCCLHIGSAATDLGISELYSKYVENSQ